MFDTLRALPPDPLLGLTIAYREDSNPNKIDLGVGVYKTETGETPVMAAVKRAEALFMDAEDSKVYVGSTGIVGANEALEELLLGADCAARADGCVRTVQTPGGCGGLRLASEFAKRCNPNVRVWVSNPTWANHIPLLKAAGVAIEEYPYYDYESHSIDFDAMMTTLAEQSRAGDLVLLHGCCHNPSGADLSRQQWQAVAELALEKGFTPFIDMAYQGFGQGLEEDVYGVRLLVDQLPEVIIAGSCSKNFGLYRERTGALTVVTNNAKQADAAISHIYAIARANYSMPPAHGSALVDIILHNDELRTIWQAELTEMRDRINSLRTLLANTLKEKGAAQDFSFIQNESGMFSFLGITAEQVQLLKEKYSIYMAGSSRINVAGINHSNVDYLADSIVAVL